MRRLAGPALLVTLALAACSPEERADPLAPTDRFYFPSGVATTRVSGGTATALLVGSSNFDLRYSAEEGGTLLSLLADASVGGGALTPIDAERIGSYGGPIAVVDAETCPTLAAAPALTPMVLVASRFDDVLYRFTLGSDGALACGPDCKVDLAGPAVDPFAIAIACGNAGRRAYVGYLHTPTSLRGSGDGAWIAEIDLDEPARPPRIFEIGDGPVASMAFEPQADRLWIATQSSGERANLYSVLLSDPTWDGPDPWQAVELTDLGRFVRGLELRSLAVGTAAPRRLYATARLYDVEVQNADSGNRPTSDVGGVLLVLAVEDDPVTGAPVVFPVRTPSLGTNAGEVAVVSRAGARDVVLATALDGDLLHVYDGELEGEGFAQVIGHDGDGRPFLGDRPMALAVDPTLVGGKVTVYVGAFGSHLVSRFQLDPANPGADVLPTLETIGGLAP